MTHFLLFMHFDVIAYFMMPWLTFWCHNLLSMLFDVIYILFMLRIDIIWTLWRTFSLCTFHTLWSHDVFFYLWRAFQNLLCLDILSILLASWHSFWRYAVFHDVISHFLMSWRMFAVLFDATMHFLYFCRHDEYFVFIMYFWRHDVMYTMFDDDVFADAMTHFLHVLMA